MPDPNPASAPAVTVTVPDGGNTNSLTVNNAPAEPVAPSPVVENDGTSTTTAPSTGDPVDIRGAREQNIEVDLEPVPVADPAAAAAVTPEPVKPTVDPVQRRINEITAKRYEAERQVAAAQARADAVEAKNTELLELLAKAGQPAPGANDPAKAPTAEELNKLIDAKADEKARVMEFNKACDAVALAGRTEFKDTWEGARQNLSLVGLLDSLDFLQTAIALEAPAKILHHLGTHLDEADRVAKLPAKQQAIELARLEAKLNAPAPAAAPAAPAVSAAPAPVTPVTGGNIRGPVDLWDSNTPSEAWYAARAKQIEDRKNRFKRA